MKLNDYGYSLKDLPTNSGDPTKETICYTRNKSTT
jgi:hypothetical protein